MALYADMLHSQCNECNSESFSIIYLYSFSSILALHYTYTEHVRNYEQI